MISIAQYSMCAYMKGRESEGKFTSCVLICDNRYTIFQKNTMILFYFTHSKQTKHPVFKCVLLNGQTRREIQKDTSQAFDPISLRGLE